LSGGLRGSEGRAGAERRHEVASFAIAHYDAIVVVVFPVTTLPGSTIQTEQ
jgi:hypothetical protein